MARCPTRIEGVSIQVRSKGMAHRRVQGPSPTPNPVDAQRKSPPFAGWTDLRPEDYDLLWEHLVLDRLRSDPAEPEVMYWRDKDHYEIDFVLPRGRGVVTAIECKWNADRFDLKNLQVFRALHPTGKHLVVATNVPKPYTRQVGGLTVIFTGLGDLAL